MVPTEEITAERLAGWSKKLSAQHATPLLLVAVGHDHVSGQVVVCIPEGIDNDMLRAHLLFVLKELPR